MLSHLSQQCWLQELQPQPELPQTCSVQLTAAAYAVAAPDELCYGSSLAALSILLYEIWLALRSQPNEQSGRFDSKSPDIKHQQDVTDL